MPKPVPCKNAIRMAAILVGFIVASASPQAQTAGAPAVPAPGVGAYEEHCASCHDAEAATLAVKKTKLSATGDVQLKSGRALSAFLTAHQVYDDQDRLDLVAYFKTLLTKPR